MTGDGKLPPPARYDTTRYGFVRIPSTAQGGSAGGNGARMKVDGMLPPPARSDTTTRHGTIHSVADPRGLFAGQRSQEARRRKVAPAGTSYVTTSHGTVSVRGTRILRAWELESAGNSTTILNTNKCIPASRVNTYFFAATSRVNTFFFASGQRGCTSWCSGSAGLGNWNPHGLGTGNLRAGELESGLQNIEFLVMRSDFSGRFRLPPHNLMGREDDSY